MFWSKNEKNRYTPAYPSCTIEKWGLRGYTLHGHVFLMEFMYKNLNVLQRLRKEAMDRVRRYKGRPYIEGPPDDIIVVKADLN